MKGNNPREFLRKYVENYILNNEIELVDGNKDKIELLRDDLIEEMESSYCDMTGETIRYVREVFDEITKPYGKLSNKTKKGEWK